MMSSTVLCAVIVASALTFSAAQSEYKLCDISTADKHLTKLYEFQRQRTRCSMSYNVQCLLFDYSFMFTMLIANYLPEREPVLEYSLLQKFCTVLFKLRLRYWRKIT